MFFIRKFGYPKDQFVAGASGRRVSWTSKPERKLLFDTKDSATKFSSSHNLSSSHVYEDGRGVRSYLNG